ncbi:MAG: sulfur carrier protein ThiS [Sandaracinaceae bacterium]
MSERVTVQVNGETREVAAASTVKQLLGELELADVLVAVEVNEEIVTRAEHDSHRVSDGDVIEIVQFVGGG